MENVNEFIGLSRAAKQFVIDGKAPHASAIYRRMTEGIKVGDRRVRLRFIRLGRRIATTEQWCADFIRELGDIESATEPRPRGTHVECQPPVTKSRTPAQRAAAIERARRELAEA
jgi:hypothetical protein